MAVIDQTPAGRLRPELRAQPSLAGARAATAMATGGSAAAGADSATRIGTLALPVVIYVLLVMLPVTFYVGPLYLTALRIYLMLMIIPMAIKLLSGKHGGIIATDILFVLHMAWAGVALAVNNPNSALTQVGSLGPEFLGGYAIARVYIRSRGDFLALCRFLGLAVCATLPLAILESQTGNPILITLINNLPGIGSVGNVNIEKRMGLQRAQVMLAHPIHYGLFCSTAFALTVLALKDVFSPVRRFVIGAAVGLCVFLSLSSGALLPIIMQIFLMIWAALFTRTGRPWLLLLLLTVAAYITIDLLSNRTPIRVFFSYATFSSHNAYWRGQIFDWGMKNVWANPLYGIGLNDWVRPFYMYSGSMDNFWLVMAVRYGIPGFVLIAAGYAHAFWRITRRDFSGDAGLVRLRRAWAFTFFGLTLTMCTVHVWTAVYSYVFFLFGAGMWLLTATPNGAAPPAAAPLRGAAPNAREAAAPQWASGDVPGGMVAAASPDAPAPGAGRGSGGSGGGTPHTRFPPRHRRPAT